MRPSNLLRLRLAVAAGEGDWAVGWLIGALLKVKLGG
jgi:hypothetical protein